jgi:two-component system, NtrC family, sensor kinase
MVTVNTTPGKTTRTSVDHAGARAATVEEQLAASNTALAEAEQLQTATSEVIRSISTFPGDVERTLEMIGRTTRLLCDADFSALVSLVDPGRMNAWDSLRSAWRQDNWEERAGAAASSFMSAAIDTRGPIHVCGPVTEWGDAYPVSAQIARGDGLESLAAVSVPMFRGTEAVGAILVRRDAPHPFETRHVSLLQGFADQAVIAIENARLFRELDDERQQQAAIAEVLKVIGSSSGDLEYVLRRVLGIAAHLCAGDVGLVWHAAEDGFRVITTHGATEKERTFLASLVHPFGTVNRVSRVADGEPYRSDVDTSTVTAPTKESSVTHQIIAELRQQAYLMVPLTRPGHFRGVFSLMRKDRRPFSQRDEDILQTFADQALIAIENSRLFHDLEDSNCELSAALEQQTAVATVLQTISIRSRRCAERTGRTSPQTRSRSPCRHSWAQRPRVRDVVRVSTVRACSLRVRRRRRARPVRGDGARKEPSARHHGPRDRPHRVRPRKVRTRPVRPALRGVCADAQQR